MRGGVNEREEEYVLPIPVLPLDRFRRVAPPPPSALTPPPILDMEEAEVDDDKEESERGQALSVK